MLAGTSDVKAGIVDECEPSATTSMREESWTRPQQPKLQAHYAGLGEKRIKCYYLAGCIMFKLVLFFRFGCVRLLGAAADYERNF